jgi:hypothetical protein
MEYNLLTDIGFDDLGIVNDFLWRTYGQYFSEVEYDDPVNDAHQFGKFVFDDDHGHLFGVEATKTTAFMKPSYGIGDQLGFGRVQTAEGFV